MSVVFQLAGKANPGASDEITLAFSQMEKGLRNEPGFERALLLLNRLTLQTQFLFCFASFEQGLAFNRKFQGGLVQRFARLLEAAGTLVTSLPDDAYEAAPLSLAQSGALQAMATATDVPQDGPVLLHFAGFSNSEELPRARAVLKDSFLPLMRQCPGYRGLSTLVNHAQGQVQFLVTLDGFDAALPWVLAHAGQLLQPFDGAVRNPSLPFFFAVLADIVPAASTVH